MFVAMMLEISRCASAALCPDDAMLIAAVQRHDHEIAVALMDEAMRENPDTIAQIRSQQIEGVSDVICDNGWPDALSTVTCKFTIRYAKYKSYKIARLVKKDGVWVIDEVMSVTRKLN